MGAEFGFGPAVVDAMTLEDVGMYASYLRRNPSSRALLMGIAAALGMKMPEKPSDEPKRYMTEAEARRMIAMTGGRIG